MEQPPRRPDAPLLGWSQLGVALALGASLLMVSFGVYVIALGAIADSDTARALAFIAFTAGNLMLIRVMATRGSTIRSLAAPDHHAYWIVAGLASVVTAGCVFLPAINRFFQFASPGPGLALLAVAVGFMSALVFDIAKWSPGIQRVLGSSVVRSGMGQRGEST